MARVQWGEVHPVECLAQNGAVRRDAGTMLPLFRRAVQIAPVENWDGACPVSVVCPSQRGQQTGHPPPAPQSAALEGCLWLVGVVQLIAEQKQKWQRQLALPAGE